MILSFIHSKGPSGRLKTSGFALGFQHFPRDLANVNEWKIMFDPSIVGEIRSQAHHHRGIIGLHQCKQKLWQKGKHIFYPVNLLMFYPKLFKSKRVLLNLFTYFP